MVTQPLILYYVVKRSFICLDEWLFYFVLYKLYKNKDYKMLMIIFLYGISCIYTSYKNIDKIEKQIIDVNQIVWVTDKSPIEIIQNVFKYFSECIRYIKK
jgi:hypothetical protein